MWCHHCTHYGHKSGAMYNPNVENGLNPDWYEWGVKLHYMRGGGGQMDQVCNDAWT